MRFVVPIENLPEDENQRYQQLHDYFCDQRGYSYQENGKWIIEPYWPSEKKYFVDPLIEKGFSWWDPTITLGQGHQQLRDMQGYQLSLNDSWTLYSWSNWLVNRTQTKGFPQEVIILHVDFHSDLMSPRLSYSNNRYNDLLTGETFDIKEPESVRKSILSGAIGVGSFMVPFLHELPKVHLRHLCEGHLTKRNANINGLKKEWEKDTLLALEKIRPKVIYQQVSRESLNNDIISYKITDNCEDWLQNLPRAPIILHIDMDYFNCRYDGDSDWQEYPPRHDPNPLIMNEKMENIFNTISMKGLSAYLEDISVSLSPGFYPAEFWCDGIQKISELVLALKK